jgi:NO-binding membrane sensor protein with MHYT domain
MGTIDHFSAGPLTPALAYVMSCLGSGLGLLCTSRARAVAGWARGRWLILAAASIGGTGIWVMHFIAMLGFSVEGTGIRYDVQRTILSLVVSIAVVGLGLSIVGYVGNRVTALLLGGTVTGVGVASMHYMGMSAMWLRAEVNYDMLIVGLSVAIAVVAATVALWMAFNIKGPAATATSALIMGVAVSGMHYTGMYSMSVDMSGSGGMAHGAEPVQFLAPLITGISLFTFVTLFIVALSPTEDEMHEEAELATRLQRLTQDQVIRRRGTIRPERSRRSAARPARPAPAPAAEESISESLWGNSGFTAPGLRRPGPDGIPHSASGAVPTPPNGTPLPPMPQRRPGQTHGQAHRQSNGQPPAQGQQPRGQEPGAHEDFFRNPRL